MDIYECSRRVPIADDEEEMKRERGREKERDEERRRKSDRVIYSYE